MKSNHLAIIGIISCVLVLGIFLLPNMIENIQVRSASKGLLNNVINNNFEKAFEHVFYFDQASDLEPLISYEDAKDKWVKRVELVKEKGIYIIDYRNLKIWQDDGYPRGEVDLVIMMDGNQVVRDDVRLWFTSREGEWKVGNFNYYKDDKNEAWESAISGQF